MEECDIVENEFESMLNNFKEAVALLSQPQATPPEDETLKNLSRQICEASRNIDRILDASKMFDQTEEELDERLRTLDEDNRHNQNQFQHVKAASGEISFFVLFCNEYF